MYVYKNIWVIISWLSWDFLCKKLNLTCRINITVGAKIMFKFSSKLHCFIKHSVLLYYFYSVVVHYWVLCLRQLVLYKTVLSLSVALPQGTSWHNHPLFPIFSSSLFPSPESTYSLLYLSIYSFPLSFISILQMPLIFFDVCLFPTLYNIILHIVYTVFPYSLPQH